jgi:tripartite-type tricarboxylate transporter receptor subunit TctC
MSKASTNKARMRAAIFRCIAIGGLLLTIPLAPAHAAEFPQRSVRFIIPFSAGGGADTLLRLLANALGTRWSQTTVVENRVGGNTVVGTVAAINSPADGYTLFFAGDQSITFIPSMMTVPYSVDKLTPITLVAKNPMLLVVTKSVPAHNLKEFIALAKAKPKTILFGSSGAGSIQRLIMELMAQSAGIELIHVPYRGSNETVAGMLSGDIHATFNGVSNFVQLLAADKLRALAVATDQRSSQLPNVPTIKEATDGQLANVDTGSWFGLFAPAGTPANIVEQVQKDVAAVLADPKVRQAMEDRGFIPVGSTSAEFGDTIKKEAVQWQKVIKEGNIRPE